MRSMLALGALAVVAATVAALSGELRAAEFPSRSRHWDPVENPQCTCRFKGEHLPLGAIRCLDTPQGPRLADCVTEQNVTSWRPRRESCPQACASPTGRDG